MGLWYSAGSWGRTRTATLRFSVWGVLSERVLVGIVVSRLSFSGPRLMWECYFI